MSDLAQKGQIIDALQKLGVEFPNTATLSQLRALLASVVGVPMDTGGSTPPTNNGVSTSGANAISGVEAANEALVEVSAPAVSGAPTNDALPADGMQQRIDAAENANGDDEAAAFQVTDVEC